MLCCHSADNRRLHLYILYQGVFYPILQSYSHTIYRYRSFFSPQYYKSCCLFYIFWRLSVIKLDEGIGIQKICFIWKGCGNVLKSKLSDQPPWPYHGEFPTGACRGKARLPPWKAGRPGHSAATLPLHPQVDVPEQETVQIAGDPREGDRWLHEPGHGFRL